MEVIINLVVEATSQEEAEGIAKGAVVDEVYNGAEFYSTEIHLLTEVEDPWPDCIPYSRCGEERTVKKILESK